MLEFSFNLGNRGGLAHIFAISPQAVRDVRKNYRTGMWQLVTWNNPEEHGGYIVHIPIRSEQKIFKEESIRNQYGCYYSISIGGKIPSCRHQDADIIKLLENNRWLVASKDNNGEWRLSGNYERPLHFTTEKTTSNSVVGLNGITFNFSGENDEPSLYLELCDLDSM